MIEQLDKKFIQYLTRQVNQKFIIFKFILYNIGSCYSRNFRNFDSFCNKKT